MKIAMQERRVQLICCCFDFWCVLLFCGCVLGWLLVFGLLLLSFLFDDGLLAARLQVE